MNKYIKVVSSNRTKVFYKKALLKLSKRFLGWRIYQSYYLAKMKVVELTKSLCYRCFPVNFETVFRPAFFIEYIWAALWFLFVDFSRKLGSNGLYRKSYNSIKPSTKIQFFYSLFVIVHVWKNWNNGLKWAKAAFHRYPM